MKASKSGLLDDVGKTLETADFEALFYDDACFDIVARRQDKGNPRFLFLKVLLNIDSILPQHANDMKIISNSTGSFAGIIGLQTRYEMLENDVVYERFGLAAFTPVLLENILINGEMPSVFRDKGGLYSEIDPERLKDARETMGLTQTELAHKIGSTKKSIYEHEKSRMRMDLPRAEKMEKVLDVSVIKPIMLDSLRSPAVKNHPKSRAEGEISGIFRKLGFETSLVCRTPFNIIAQEEETIFAHAEANLPSEKRALELKAFSDITKNPVIVISDKEFEMLPSIKKSRLRNISCREEIYDIIDGF